MYRDYKVAARREWRRKEKWRLKRDEERPDFCYACIHFQNVIGATLTYLLIAERAVQENF